MQDEKLALARALKEAIIERHGSVNAYTTVYGLERRNFTSRYLSGKREIPLAVLREHLQRLNVPLGDFMQHVEALIQEQESEEPTARLRY